MALSMGDLSILIMIFTVVLATAVAIASAVSLFQWLTSREVSNFPPGPKPHPVIGKLIGNLSILKTPLPHRELSKLAEEYGDLMFMRLGSRPCIVVNSARKAQEIYNNHDKNFSSRPEGLINRIMAGDYASVSMAPQGPHWKRLRSICAHSLSKKSISTYEKARMEEIQEMLKTLDATSRTGATIDLHVVLQRVSSNMITQMLINKRYFSESTDEHETREFQEMLEERLQISGIFVYSDYVPFLRPLDYFLGYEKQAQLVQDKTMGVCKQIMNLDERKQRLAEEKSEIKSANDLVDAWLCEQSKDTTGHLTDDAITFLVQDFLVAGTDTSAMAIEWAMAELIRHPECLQRAQEEIASYIGRRNVVEESDLNNLPYLAAIVKETLRLHPAAPLNLPRVSTTDCFIDGFHLPGGTRLILNVWKIQRDPDFYERPNSFLPQRFVDSPQVSMHYGNFFQLVPFGLGRRGCPGFDLASLIVPTVLGNLIHSFDWTLPYSKDPHELDMTEDVGLTAPRKDHLLVIPRARRSAFMP